MGGKQGLRVGVCVVAMLVAQGAVATEYDFLNARAQGMGGVGAVSTRDATVQWYNPAILGFMHQEPIGTNGVAVASTNGVPVGVSATNGVVDVASTNDLAVGSSATNEVLGSVAGTNGLDGAAAAAPSEPLDSAVLEQEEQEPVYNPLDRNGLSERDFGWNVLDVNLGYAMTGNMGKYLNLFDNIDFDLFGENGLEASGDGIKSMLALGTALGGLSSKDTLYADANVGTGFRFGHWGVGVRAFGEGAAYVSDLDLKNIGISQAAGDFVIAINQAATEDGYFDIGFQTISQPQYDSMTNKLVTAGVAAADAQRAVSYLDNQLTELVNETELSPEDIQNAVNLVNEIDFGGDLSNNTSVAVGRAFAAVEIPVSYGRAFLDDRLAVGVTLRGIYGTVTGVNLWFFDENAIDDAIEVASDDTEASLNFGLDLGVMYRLPMVQLSAVGRNLNSPTFKGFQDTVQVGNQNRTITIDDVTLDPQITLGAAFIPSERFTLEVNYDVLKTSTLLDGYDIQRLSFGTELDVWLVALRLGVYNNIAVDDSDWVATVGLGLNLWGVRADVGGAYSLGDTVAYNGTEIPREARLSASISLDY